MLKKTLLITKYREKKTLKIATYRLKKTLLIATYEIQGEENTNNCNIYVE